jgi:hypothetical protein
MAIEISPSEDNEPEDQQEPEEQYDPEGQYDPEDSPALQPVPPQDSPTQFYEWALRREQVRLRKVVWAFAIFAALSLLISAVLAYFVWDTRGDLEPRVIVQEGGATQESVDQLQKNFDALSARVEEIATSGAAPEEALASMADDLERMGRQLAALNRRQTAAIVCLDDSIAALDEAVRDLLRQDISANDFVQRPATNCE